MSSEERPHEGESVLVRHAETEWSRALFEDEPVTCETKLAHLLAASPSY